MIYNIYAMSTKSNAMASLVPSLVIFLLLPFMAASDPQTHLVVRVCGPVDAGDPTSYFAALNSTFPDLRSDLSSTFYASAQASAYEPVFSLFQCREYLSAADCLSCFDAAASLIGSCYPRKSGFAVYDGCTIGYRSSSRSFDGATNSAGPPSSFCEDEIDGAAGFGSKVAAAVEGLVREVPKRRTMFGAAKVGGEGSVVYAVGQCLLAESVGRDGCRSCLEVAYDNMNGCPPAVGGRSVNLECFLRYSDRPFFNESKVILVDKPGGNDHRKKLIVGISAGVAVVAFCCVLIAVIFFIRRSRDIERIQIDRRLLNELGLTEMREPVSFQYSDLKNATGNFSDENKLGEGGFGVVYKGVLKRGQIVAVKKLIIGENAHTRTGFEREIVFLSNTRHRNLVSLLGYCRKGPDLLLVYEYMEKGSLDKIIFGGKSETLNWNQRFDIIVGIARGLAYLHEDFYIPIIHRDIKCGNILLDDQLQAKIGDFGLARLFPEDQSHIQTRLAGTVGYTAPEYMLHGVLSEKADAYSFGIIILEIISGRKCNDMSVEPYLLEWAWRLYETDSLADLADKSLKLKSSETEALKMVVQVGLMCTQSSHLRPAMSEALVILLNDGYSRVQLLRPSFLDTNPFGIGSKEKSVSSTFSSSGGTMTMSHFSAR